MRQTRTLLLVLFSLTLVSTMVLGQVTTGTILGTVTDASGALVPGATVTVTSLETGAGRTAASDATGTYRVLSLPVGRYEVKAETPGFKAALQTGISLVVGQEAVVNLRLAVGAVQEQVTVTGEAPLVNTTTASVSGLVGERQVKDLPLNGRSFDNLITLNPGAVNYSALKTGPTGGGGEGNYFTVSGRRPHENLFLLNGIEYTGSSKIGITPGGVSGQLLGIDAVREFNVVTDAYSAEYGKRAGAQVSVVTQSGTNQLHGSAFEFLRNDKLDARNFFDQGNIPAFRRNQFGGSLGGPIRKDKSFLFGNYEGFRQRLGVSNVAIVPDDNARRGFLPIGPNNSLIQVPNLDPRMLPFTGLWPQANGSNLGGGLALWVGNPKQSIREDFETARFDQNLSDTDTFTASHTFDDGRLLSPLTNPFFGALATLRSQVVSAQETHVFSPQLLNTARAGYSRAAFFFDSPPLVPLPPNVTLFSGKAPGPMVIGGGSAAGASSVTPGGTSITPNSLNIRNLFTYGDDAQVIRGKHQLGFGAWFQHIQVNANDAGRQGGQATFASLQTFLQGISTAFTGVPNATALTWTSLEGAWYIQDVMQVKPNLSVRVGLRHEFTNGWNEKHGRAAQFVPDSNGVLQSQTRVANSAFVENNATKLFSPRVGIAWDPFGKGKTSIRAGFGMYYTLLDNLTFHLDNVTPFNTLFSLDNVSLPSVIPIVPGTPLPPPCGPVVPAPCTTLGPEGVQVNAKTPTVLEWNYSLEQQLSRNTSLRLAYVGSHGYHNLINIDPNTVAPQICSNPDGCLASGIRPPLGRCPPAPGNSCVPQGAQYIPAFLEGAPATRPNKFLASGFFWYTVGVSTYHSVQVDVTKRFSGGLVFRANYTFSKNLDNGAGLASSQSLNQTNEVLDPRNPRRDYGPSSLNFSHEGSGNFSYELPFGRGKPFLGGLSGVADKLVGGWQVNAIATFLSGFPFTPLLGTNQSGDGNQFTPDRPNVNPSFTGSRKIGRVNKWYDAAAFSLPIPGTFGNAGRGVLKGPGLAEFDFSVFKTIPLKERASLGFRAEFFNIPNRANFNLPNPIVFSGGNINPSAGKITITTTSSRQIQFGLKLIF